MIRYHDEERGVPVHDDRRDVFWRILKMTLQIQNTAAKNQRGFTQRYLTRLVLFFQIEDELPDRPCDFGTVSNIARLQV